MKKFLFALSIILALLVITADYAQAQTKVKTTTKKGWSHKAKDATIGAGAGAVAGAVVSRHKGKGAIIGGAVGAGAGYLIGRHKDKKDPNRKTITKYKKTVE